MEQDGTEMKGAESASQLIAVRSVESPKRTTKINAALLCPCPGPCPYANKSGAGERKTRGRESGLDGDEAIGSGTDARWSDGGCGTAVTP